MYPRRTYLHSINVLRVLMLRYRACALKYKVPYIAKNHSSMTILIHFVYRCRCTILLNLSSLHDPELRNRVHTINFKHSLGTRKIIQT